MKITPITGKTYSIAEAMDILTQVKALRISLDVLEAKAHTSMAIEKAKIHRADKDLWKS